MIQIIPREPRFSQPLFCPNPACAYHARTAAREAAWFTRFGTFTTAARGHIQRFRCRACGKTCSTQTFSTHYWTHSTGDLKHLEYLLTSCSGLRQIGRITGTSYRVVKNRIHRLARQYLTLFAQALEGVTPAEDVVFDGLESYLRSQYFPVNINIIVGADSQACFAMNLSVLRRKGRMTPRQKEIRRVIDRVWRPRPRALERRVMRLFSDMRAMLARGVAHRAPWRIRSDEKREYPRAFARVRCLRDALRAGTLIHETTSSRAARTVSNRLFAVNYIDREIRKDMGDHVRETVKQAREANCMMERIVIKLGSHTFRKPYRISGVANPEAERTHADVAGLGDNVTIGEWLYTHRQVYSHIRGEARGMTWIRTIWRREYKNPPIVDLESGTEKRKGAPREAWFAHHLVA